MSRRVLVAVGAGTWSVRTVGWLRHVLAGTPARVWLLRVQSAAALAPTARGETRVRVAASDLAPLRSSLREMGLEVEPSVRVATAPPAIAAVAEEARADLVVLAAADAELSRVWLRRVLEDMGRTVAVPVLVMPGERRRVS
jgi:hypothetical protein